jgi:hypothetical protein
VVPTGCLTVIVLFFVFMATIALAVFGMLKETDVYKTAVTRAKNDPRVATAIGTPIKEGRYVGGSTQISGGSGKSDLSIPIRGPKGTATTYVMATGNWQYSKLVVKVEGTGETIDLGEQSPKSGE